MSKKIEKYKHFCKFCGKEFLAKKSALYCSRNCSVKYYNKEKRLLGRKISQNEKKINFNSEIDYFKVIKIKIPFTKYLSKNIMGGLGKWTHRPFLKKKSREIRETISWLIKKELIKKKIKFVQDKIWISIIVQKPDMKQLDPINIIDLVCDGIKQTIGVDDRWFCIKILDWQIVKENPEIIIEIGQSNNIPKRICSYCGRILPFSNFRPNKSGPNGLHRVCNKCRITSSKN